MLGHKPDFRHYLQVTATYALLIAAVAAGTYFVVQLARGYQLNLSQQELELTGLIRFESNPDATVIIDGENSGEQTPARLSLVEGERQIALEQDGFQRWSRDIAVNGGSVNSITYPFLVPFDVEAGTEPVLSLENSSRYVFDQSGSLLAIEEDGRIAIYQLQDDEFNEPYRQISLPSGTTVERIIWSESSEQLLYQINGDEQSWIVADVSEPNPETVDITNEVGNFKPEGFVLDVEPKVLLHRDGQLWLLSVDDQTLQLLTRNADAFTFNNSVVVWHEVNQPESLQAWSENEQTSIPVLEDIEGSVELALSGFSNQTNIAYTQSGVTTKVIVDALTAPFERELDLFSGITSISPGGRFVLGSGSDGKYLVHDVEQNQTHSFKLVDELSTLKWSGTHHFVARGESGVYVVDYEGSNQRRVNFEQAGSAILNAQKTAVFSVVDEQLLITPLR